MQYKQAVTILEDNPERQSPGLYTSTDKDCFSDLEGVNTAIDGQPVGQNTFGLFAWILRAFRLSATTSLRIVSWLSRLGSNEIDVKAIEASHNYHLGLGIKGMGL